MRSSRILNRGTIQEFTCSHTKRIRKEGYIMGFFNKILDKLGLNKKKEADEEQEKKLKEMARKEGEARAKLEKEAPKPATSTPAAKPVAAPQPSVAATKASAPAAPATPAVITSAVPEAISEVDVVSKLEALAKGKGLNWKVSIADLLALLEIDHSREARIELAKELGCPEELMGGDLSKMNVWLHKTVLKKIAENGGNIPQELLD
jgi:hypothetical protein